MLCFFHSEMFKFREQADCGVSLHGRKQLADFVLKSWPCIFGGSLAELLRFQILAFCCSCMLRGVRVEFITCFWWLTQCLVHCWCYEATKQWPGRCLIVFCIFRGCFPHWSGRFMVIAVGLGPRSLLVFCVWRVGCGCSCCCCFCCSGFHFQHLHRQSLFRSFDIIHTTETSVPACPGTTGIKGICQPLFTIQVE